MKYLARSEFKYFFGKLLTENHFCTKYLSKVREPYLWDEFNQMIEPSFKKAFLYGNNIAIKDLSGTYSYLQLYSNSRRLSRQISNICGSGSCSTVAFFYIDDVLTTLFLWSCWMSGQVAMPIRCDKTFTSLRDSVKNEKTKLILTSEKYIELGRKLSVENNIPLIAIDYSFIKYRTFDTEDGILRNEFYNNSTALILNDSSLNQKYLKSNTVLLSHNDINSLMKTLNLTWPMSSDDRILNLLPTSQYISDYINIILFPLSAGCNIQILEPFDKSTWSYILGVNIPIKERVNVLIGEPNVFKVLIEEYDKCFAKNNRMVIYIKYYCLRNIRLMLSCRGVLLPALLSRWFEITGHYLLENKFQFSKIYKSEGSVNEHLPPITHSSPKTKIRVVDAANNVLLESVGVGIKKIQVPSTILVGRLMLSTELDEDYFSTGDIVSYQEGVLKIIGQCTRK